MADEVVDPVQQVVDPQQAQQDYIKEQMGFALGTNKPMPQETIVPKEDIDVVDPNVYLKEQLGFDNWDLAKSAVAELKAFKEKPPTAAEIKFANEQSRKIHEALREGKTEAVENYLQSQKLLKDIDVKPDGDKLKLYIQLTNPMFDAELVEDEFQEQYGVNEADYEDNAVGLKKAKVKAAQRMANDVAKANEYFTTYRQKIELPDISPVDEGYVSYKKNVESAPELAKQAADAYSKITPASIEKTFEFNDEANKLKIPFQYKPDDAGFNKARETVLDEQKFYDQFLKPDGSSDREAFLEMVYFHQNKDKVIANAMKAASNATRLQMINSATAGAGQNRRELVVTETGELNELEQHMQNALGQYMPKKR